VIPTLNAARNGVIALKLSYPGSPHLTPETLCRTDRKMGNATCMVTVRDHACTCHTIALGVVISMTPLDCLMISGASE
jgi:hypothetical protein